MRGENKEINYYQEIFPGTSPRARGKLPLISRGGEATRNIPACAGKTRTIGS